MSYNGIEVVHVVAMDQNNCIGKQGKLPWHITEDLRRFKKITDGGIVVMGRKTYESIGKALSNRVNIVVSRDGNFSASGLGVIAGSVEYALLYATNQAKKLNQDQIFIIGGAEIYAQTMDIVDRIELTRIKTFIKDGDAFYPEIDADIENGIFKLVSDGLSSSDRFYYDFVTYARKVNTTVGKDDGEWCVINHHGEILYHALSFKDAQLWTDSSAPDGRNYTIEQLHGQPLTKDQIDFFGTLSSKFAVGVNACPHPPLDRGLLVDDKQQCFHCGELVESGKLFDALVQPLGIKKLVHSMANTSVASLKQKHSHYHKSVAHLKTIDVYRLIDLYAVTDPCLQHALKKILCAGVRGAKDQGKDIQEAIDTLTRWQEMQAENEAMANG